MKKSNLKYVLIAGSNSFSGLNLSKFLIKKKCHVLGTYNKKRPNLRSKYFVSKKIDLRKKFFLNENVDTIIHISSHHKIHDFNKSSNIKYNENILMTENLINFAGKKNVKNLIFFSTIDIKEKIKPKKKVEYIRSKIKSEYLYSLSLKKRIFKKVLFLRLPAILGKNCNDNFLKNTIKNLKLNKPIKIWNNQKLYDNFIHIENLNNLIYYFFSNTSGLKRKFIECKVKNPMTLEKTIFYLKKFIKSKSKINTIKVNKKIKNVKKKKKVLKYNFFTSKKTLLLFLKDNKINYK